MRVSEGRMMPSSHLQARVHPRESQQEGRKVSEAKETHSRALPKTASLSCSIWSRRRAVCS